MSSVAFLWGDVNICWAGIYAALGILSACLAAASLQLAGHRPLKPLSLFIPAAILFSLIFCRVGHWYSFPLQYESFTAAMTDYSIGGFSLMPGALLGILLAAALVRLASLTEELPGFLDTLAPALALGLAVGRLGSLFDLSGRGSFLPPQPFLQQLPFSAPAANADGTVSWHFAAFGWQAMAAAGLFVVCLILLAAIRREKKGHVFALFLNFYAAAEIVLDSTRYDGAFLRSNGFIHVTQLCCLVLLVGICVLYSAATIRNRGFRRWIPVLWGAFLALGGLGGYMEYFVQRHGDRFVFAYSIMAAAFMLMAVINVILFRRSRKTA